MSAQLIDGKAVARTIQLAAREGAIAFAAAHGRAPALHFILVGDDPASHKHVGNKERAIGNAGMRAGVDRLPADTAPAALLARVRELNGDPSVDGILVQLPLPAHFDTDAVLAAIDPGKDVDGLTPHNAGLLALGRARLMACTPLGCMRLIEETGVDLAGKRALVIGRSALVGRPVSSLLLARDATVTIAHSHTRELYELAAQADVVVSAAGVAGLVCGAWIKPGAVVIDVGQNRNAEGKLCGDVEFEAARERAGFITPVPGGVGPMTVAMLVANTLRAAQARASP
jgi:methylenetetrahydrofolate dehydrogenase (NADP+)/methenyltetrahydrofolate cyclohydrolase